MNWKNSTCRFICILLLSLSPLINFGQRSNAWLNIDMPEVIDFSSTDQNFGRVNIGITNISSRMLKASLTLSIPEGYQLVTSNLQNFELSPGKTIIIPITLSKSKNASAGKSAAELKISLLNLMTQIKIPFSISNKEVKELRVIQGKSNFEITPENRKVALALRLRNMGNTLYAFSINYDNNYLNLHKKMSVAMPAQMDTTVVFEYTIPRALVNQFEIQKIIATVGTENDYITHAFTISKTKNTNAQHKSAYNLIPVTLETGVFAFGEQLQYYFGLGSDITFDKNNNLSLNYRSKTYGVQGLQNHFFIGHYRHKKLEMNFGQLSESRNTLAMGLGAELLYRFNDSAFVGAKYISNLTSTSPMYSNQQVQLQAALPIGKMLWQAYLMGDHDTFRGTSAAIFENELRILGSHSVELSAKMGLGKEKDLKRSLEHPLALALGYNFRFSRNRWHLNSNLQAYGSSFPGMYKGWRNFSNDANYKMTDWAGLKAYYNQNYTRHSYFLDSTYFDNQLLYNVTNYGLQGTFFYKNLSLFAGYGRESTNGDFSNMALPEYHSITGGATLALGNVLRWQISGAYNMMGSGANTVRFYNLNTSLGSKYGGLNAYYMVRPVMVGDGQTPQIDGFRNSYHLAPFVNFNLFYNKIKGRIQYSIFGNQIEQKTNQTQSLLGSLSYTDQKRGLFMSLSGNYYLKSTAQLPFMASLTIRKTFDLPVIVKRKYYDLNVQLFEDKNGNLSFDGNDSLLGNVSCNINNKSFRTTLKGGVQYRNLEKDTYALDFTKMNYIDGLIPVKGFKQNIIVEKQTTVQVPFNKGREIRGSVTFIKDSLSAGTFSTDQLKISAVDTNGNTFVCYTDWEGQFKLSLPAAQYIVSLNPDAFDENFKPVAMAQKIDLLHNEKQQLAFYVKQKARRINKIKAEL